MASLVTDLIRRATGHAGHANSGDEGQYNNVSASTPLTEEDIICQHCTYINPPQSLACGMCSNPFVNLTSDASEVNDVPAIYPSNSDNVLIARVVDLGYDTSKSDQRSREAHLDRKRKPFAEHVDHTVRRTASMELADELNIDRLTARTFLNEHEEAQQQNRRLSDQKVETSTRRDPNTGKEVTTHTIDVSSLDTENNVKQNSTDLLDDVPSERLNRLDSDELATSLGVPIEEARSLKYQQVLMKFKREREEEQSRRDAEIALRLANAVEKDCLCCLETFSIENMYTLDCNKSHRVCFDCIKRSVQPAFEQRKLPRCPFGNECGHTLTLLEVTQIFGKHSKYCGIYEELELENTLASNAKTYLPCPRPGCKDYCFAERPGSKEKAICPTCKFEFCSLCKDKYHYHLACAELSPTAERWFKWIQTDCAKFHGQYGKAMKAVEALKHAEQQFKNLQQDEAWKEKNCRLCPHCKKVVYRVDGCSSMTCGRDAADKGGGNRQDGCGKKFNWNQAKRYKRGADKAHLPKELKDVDMRLAKEIFHYLIRPENLKPGDNIEAYKRQCDNCYKPIKGPVLLAFIAQTSLTCV